MITGSIDLVQVESWQQQLAGAVRSPRQLLELLGLTPQQVPSLDSSALDFPLRVPLSYTRRMARKDPCDPLLLQVLPQLAEQQQQPGYTDDPLHETSSGVTRGIIHKYRGRVLLITTGACAIHCRYCFRRHFPYQEHQQTPAHWATALDYIRRDPSISEVILSGGDPLVLGGGRLAKLLAMLAAIPQLRRLRIHSRLPVVLPARIDSELLNTLQENRLKCSVVIHSNHPRELNTEVAQGLGLLRGAGVTLLNQSVLLRGINDHADTLCQLSEALYDMDVLPYYLHLLDRVNGSAHFNVSELTSTTIYRQMLERLPGYLVPKMVRENPAYPYKTPVFVN
jgi:EF-P beta-lysylation protein EpmB